MAIFSLAQLKEQWIEQMIILYNSWQIYHSWYYMSENHIKVSKNEQAFVTCTEHLAVWNYRFAITLSANNSKCRLHSKQDACPCTFPLSHWNLTHLKCENSKYKTDNCRLCYVVRRNYLKLSYLYFHTFLDIIESHLSVHSMAFRGPDTVFTWHAFELCI